MLSLHISVKCHPFLQNKELAATLKKQQAQLNQLEAAAKAAEQQHQTQLQELQQQLEQAKSLPPEPSLEGDQQSRADLASLRTQLQDARDQIRALEQRSTPSNAPETGDANARPSSVTSTPTKPSDTPDAASSAPAVAADKDQGGSSAEAQLAEAQKRLGT